MLSSISLTLALPSLVVSCATAGLLVHPSSLHTVDLETKDWHAKRQAELVTVPGRNTTHWTVAQNLREMQVTDDAFVAQDLANFNHAQDITVFQSGGVTRNLSEHFTDIRLVYSMVPDIELQNHNYIIRFGEGDWTVVISKVTGTNGGPIPAGGPTGLYLPPSHRQIDYPLMTIGRWEHGLLQDEYLWSDEILSYRQLGLLPDAPTMPLPDIYFDPFGNVGPDHAAANKKSVNISDNALNHGSFSAEALLYSPDLTVYGLSDQPMDLDAYLQYLESTRQTFPDLEYVHQQVIAQGEWTATLGMLSGTQDGAWTTLPTFLAGAPIPPTHMSFNLLHYVIARWEDGKIVDMRVYLDLGGILGALGVQYL